MKALLSTVVAVVLATAGFALETPLVIKSGGQGGNYAVIEPGIGNVTLYAVEGNTLTKYGSVNFLADLAFLEQRPFDERDGIVYSTLRIGDAGCKPTMADLLAAFPAKPSKREAEAGLKSYMARAIEAENEFWSKEHAFDGIVRGAYSATVLFLCIPSKHAVLLYDCQDRTKPPRLAGWRNYGVELMIPQVFGSTPTPQDLLAQLPAEVKDDQKKALEESMKALAEGGGAIQLQPSDPWVAAGGGDRFVLVDPPNKHIMTYEYKGKGWEVKSVRNLEVDMMIPTAMSSAPDEQRNFAEYLASRKNQLAGLGIVPDLPYFKALVGQKQVDSGKTSDVQATSSADDVVIDYVKLHKLYVYRLIGRNNALELVSMRDYTLDIGLALQDVEFRAEADAADAWADAKRALQKHDNKVGLLSVMLALKRNPCLYKVIEKDPAHKDLKKLPEWQPLLDEAIKACEAKTKELEERKKKAEEERKAKAGKK
jgi:hypothetical protein